MSTTHRSSLWVIALMAVSPLLAWLLTPVTPYGNSVSPISLESAVPKHFGDWQALDNTPTVVPTVAQEKTLNAIYSDIVSRTYANQHGVTIMLTIAYGSAQTKQLRAHRQEVCYSAQGFKIDHLKHADITVDGRTIPATRMRATQGSRSEPVTYWFTMGDDVVRSLVDREIAQLKHAFSGYVPDGYLVRISSLSTEVDQAFDGHLQFAAALFKNLDPRLAGRLLGRKSQE